MNIPGKTPLAVVFAALLVLLAALPASAVVPSRAQLDGPNTQRAVVLFESEPTATAVGSAHGAAAEAHRAQLAQERAAFAAWLQRNAPQARIIIEYDTVLNGVSVELNGANSAALAGGPGVRTVLHPHWMSPAMNESLPLIGWPGGDPATPGISMGAGVFVGVIDSGIDHNHPFFDDNYTWYKDGDTCLLQPADPGDPNYTNCKVVVAKVFHPDAHTPQDFIAHGTHVAGTVAGNSGTSGLSGVAPGAFLGNYNVFPGDTGSASSDDIADAVEAAVADGVRVLNLSLGGSPPRSGWDVLELALQSAANAGVISAVSAGNSGPGAGTVGSPGRAPWVLTAGASTNPHFEGQSAQAESLPATGAAVGDFHPFDTANPVTAPFVWWDTIDGRGEGLACENRPLRGVDLSGKIALIKRGDCTFSTKIRNAEGVNAIGAIIFNNVAGDPTAMGHDGTEPFPAIPAVMVSLGYGTQMTGLSGSNVTVGGPIEEQSSDAADIIAGFSSRGPIDTPDGLIIKPDMVAPGVNIRSSIPCEGTECGFAYFQGTSMAAPHLAGAAAALLWLDGGLNPHQVKSLLVNNATRGVVTDHRDGSSAVGVNTEGAGRLQLDAAFGGTFYANPVSVSFGALAGGTATATRTVTLSGGSGPWTAAVTSGPGLSGVTVTAEIVNDTLLVTMTRSRGVRGDFEGVITINNGADQVHLVYWGRL